LTHICLPTTHGSTHLVTNGTISENPILTAEILRAQWGRGKGSMVETQLFEPILGGKDCLFIGKHCYMPQPQNQNDGHFWLHNRRSRLRCSGIRCSGQNGGGGKSRDRRCKHRWVLYCNKSIEFVAACQFPVFFSFIFALLLFSLVFKQ
jgi:hypothetical protein